MEMWPWISWAIVKGKVENRAIILYKKLSSSIENGCNHVTFWSVGGGIECDVYVLISRREFFLCGFCVGVQCVLIKIEMTKKDVIAKLVCWWFYVLYYIVHIMEQWCEGSWCKQRGSCNGLSSQRYKYLNKIYLWRKVVCFVLLCFVLFYEIHQTRML